MSTVKRTALVTGGMGGLGQEIARALHDAGHQVLVTHSRSEADAQVWLKEQADAGYVFQGYHVDVADFESCQQMAQAIEKDGLQVDILINNAGITRDGTFRKLSKDKWDDVLRVNLDSVFNVTKPFIDGMLERTWGRVINISSDAARVGSSGESVYSACKGGIIAFSKSLAREMALDPLPLDGAQTQISGPKSLYGARVSALVDAAIKETGAASKKEMGKVIGALKKHPDAALIDFGAVSKIVQAKLP